MDRIILTAVSAALISFFSWAALAGNGNNLPPGPRYNLQVIAYDNCPAGDFTGSNRHQISVKADYQVVSGDLSSHQGGTAKQDIIKQNTIKLAPSDDSEFRVADGNACRGRGDGAELILPRDIYGKYKVYVRLVGGPNTGIGVTSCAEELDLADFDGNGSEEEILCSTENVIEFRGSGSGGKGLKFTDYTKELLTVCVDTFDDLNFDGECDVRLGLFDPQLEYYFWQWNTQGRAHAQLVFVLDDSP
jgi:hypothetical protein